MPGDDEVQFQSPTSGAVQAVPPEHWDEAIKQGYKPTTHTVMYSPDGQRGMVHNSQLREKVNAGYQIQPKTQFEQDRTPTESSVSRFASGALDATKGIVSGLTNLDLSPTGAALTGAKMGAQIGSEDAARKEEGRSAAYRGIAAVGTGLGINARGMEEAADRGDSAGILGQAAVPAGLALAPAALRLGAKVLPSAERIGLAARTERGAIKPGLRRTAGLAGAGLGHMTGIPGAEVIGYASGGPLADWLIPERPFDVPVKENPGAPLPAADEFYGTRAKDLMTRGRAEDAAQRAAAKTSVTTGSNLSNRFVLSPEEWTAKDQIQGIATKRAGDRGMLYAGGLRPGKLTPAPPTAEPGLRPSPTPPQRLGGSPDSPSPSPQGLRPSPRYKPGEKATTMSGERRDLGPEFNAQQQQEEINRNNAILRNPKATAEERAIATDRLRDAREGAAKVGQ